MLVIDGLFSDLKKLQNNIKANNCFDLKKVNESYSHINKEEVATLLSNFMIQHLDMIMKMDEFLNLMEGDIMIHLESQYTQKCSESVKWEALINWVHHVKQRETAFSRLFSKLDLTSISESYLFSVVWKEPLLQASPGCANRLVHKGPAPCFAILGFFTSELMVLYEDGSIRSLPVSENLALGIVAINGEMYAVTIQEILKLHSDGKRTIVQQLDDVNCFSKIVLFQKRIYILEPYAETMLCFDPSEDSLSSSLPGCELGHRFCVAASNDCIYARIKLQDPAALILDDKLYVLGGWGSTDSVEQYDPESNSWSEITTMNAPHMHCTAFFNDGQLYAVGGKLTKNKNGCYECSIQVYQKYMDKWMTVQTFETRDLLNSACIWTYGSTEPDDLFLQLRDSMDRRIKTKSTKSKIIGLEGGWLKNFGCRVTFPLEAYNKDTKVETSVITDFSGHPYQRIPIAPILQCSPSGRLNQPARLEFETWAYPTQDDEPILAEVFRKDTEDSEWTFLKEVRIEKNGKVSFTTEHFSIFEIVLDYAKWFWSKLKPLPCKVALQNLVYISAIDQTIACVCCLKDDKVKNDVAETLRNARFMPLLPAPERVHGNRGEDVRITIRCLEPRNLKIALNANDEGNVRYVREVDHDFPVNDMLRKCQEFRYLPLDLDDGDLKKYDGRLRFRYSHAAADDENVQHILQIVWPIPDGNQANRAEMNVFGNIRTNTILAPNQ